MGSLGMTENMRVKKEKGNESLGIENHRRMVG